MRRAFHARGHDAWSCDLLPAEDGETRHHHVGDVLAFAAAARWDLCIFHPPCTDLASSGARWWKAKGPARRDAALGFVQALWAVDCPRVALENPVGRLSTLWLPPHTDRAAVVVW